MTRTVKNVVFCAIVVFQSNGIPEIVKVVEGTCSNVRAKFHQTKCSGS